MSTGGATVGAAAVVAAGGLAGVLGADEPFDTFPDAAERCGSADEETTTGTAGAGGLMETTGSAGAMKVTAGRPPGPVGGPFQESYLS